jgi:long-chain acyl-CoA synthetase
LEFVKNLIVYDITQNVSQKQLEDLKKSKLNIHLFSDLVKKPQEKSELKISNAETILTLCYTSGTTALPKGAKLSQRNFYATLTTIEDAGFNLTTNSFHLSYLPLAHVMERLVMMSSLQKGAKVCFAAGDLRTKLLENIELARPTFLVAVPRVLDTFRKVLFDKFSKLQGCKKSLTEKAIRVKRENFRNTGVITHSIYDKVVFSKIRQAFGGRVELFVTGSAPMTRDLAEDIKILFSVPIVEGYGMTECCAALCVSHTSDLSNNSVGGCIQGQKMKLFPVPEMNYSATTKLGDQASPTGEICMKGPCVFHGYFMNPEETKKTFDAEGWLHSGDVGRIMPGDQGLKIIDRVKEIFKLSQGEYIAPSKLESLYSKSKYVTQICVYGDSTHSFLIAIIVPNKANLKTVADSSNLDDDQKLFYDKNVVDAIKKDFETIVKENNLNGLEKIHNFHLTTKEFSVDNGCLTPTMKLVRRKVEDLFKPEIQALYGKNDV